MSSIEIDLEHLLPRLEVRGGRRVVVLDAEVPGTPEVLLVLPRRDPWLASYRLAVALDRMTAEVRAQSRGDQHRGGSVIVSSAESA